MCVCKNVWNASKTRNSINCQEDRVRRALSKRLDFRFKKKGKRKSAFLLTKQNVNRSPLSLIALDDGDKVRLDSAWMPYDLAMAGHKPRGI